MLKVDDILMTSAQFDLGKSELSTERKQKRKTRTGLTFPRKKPSLPPGGDLTWLLAAKFVSPPRQCWQTSQHNFAPKPSSNYISMSCDVTKLC